jgi:hypothetical protein
MSTAAAGSVEYARRVYDSVYGWYSSAETKAQVILSIDGAFLALLTAGIFRKPEELRDIVGAFSLTTGLSLLVMTGCLLTSIAAAIWCLRSRTLSADDLQRTLGSASQKGSGPYPARLTWFFQYIAALNPDHLRDTLAQADATFEVEALASQIFALAVNVRDKHRAVNLGFLMTGLTLCAFLVAGCTFAFVDAR